MAVYTKPCGCSLDMRAAPEHLVQPDFTGKQVLALTCPKHEVVFVLRERGDKGLLGPKEKGDVQSS